MNTSYLISLLIAAAHLALVAGISVRVIMKRPATGVALAWLLLVFAAPFVGAGIYLLIGERRVSRSRAKRLGALRAEFADVARHAVRQGLFDVEWPRHPRAARQLDRLGRACVGTATVCGSSLSLYDRADDVLRRIADDIDQAQTSVLMEFYIWNEGGAADEVLEATIRAAERGVACRVLIDALGARPWWRGQQPQRMRTAGVDLRPALPTGLFRAFIGRTDLRLHRKIVAIDGRVAWTGSMNLVDPRYFKQNEGVGQWVDAMARLEGGVVAVLTATLIGDWILETGESVDTLVESSGMRLTPSDGPADIQVLSSGPGETGDGLLQLLLEFVNAAEDELVLTTPYFVPDESLLRALRGAARRGVKVKLVLPEKVDSFLTRHASRSYYDDLLAVGIDVYLYRAGLLHTKSITVDGRMSMFGTVNLDMRSLWLNFEVSLLVYDDGFTRELRALQQGYISDADELRSDQWGRRPFGHRLLENTLRLVSPLL